MENKRKKTLIYGLVTALSIIAVITVGALFLKGGTYKAYANSKHKFSMLYPDGWAMSEQVPGVAVQFFTPLESEVDPFKENVNIVYQDHSVMPMAMDQYTQTAIEQVLAVFKQNVQIIESSPTVLAGRPAHKFLYIGSGSGTEIKILHVWTTANNQAYQFTYAAIPYKFDKYWPQAKKMLNSFKIQ
jgi:hypothetical protein